MPVLVNFKICDNADVCSGVAICPTNAIYWDKAKSTLCTDNSKCTSCGLCEDECPAGAIIVAKDEQEYQQFVKRIDDDPRTLKDLMVERYGASPIDLSIQISVSDAEDHISNDDNIIAIEVIDDLDTQCLINSIPISELFNNSVYGYFKISTNAKTYHKFEKKYEINNIPTLLIFKEGHLIVKIDGVVQNNIDSEKTELINRIKMIV